MLCPGRLRTALPTAAPYICCIYRCTSQRSQLKARRHVPAASASKEAHVAKQAEHFANAQSAIQESITPEIDARLQTIVNAIPGLSSASRVLDAGCGTGALIPHLQARGVRDILAVDVTPQMIAAVEARWGKASTLGNDVCVRTWVGDVADVPAYQGPFDAFFFNAVFGNLLDQHEALTNACFLLRPGGHLVVSHPLGRAWLDQLRADNPEIVPHSLPLFEEWELLTHDLPLQLLTYEDSPDLYLALLQVPEGYAHPRAPIRLSGPVTAGFGRGSKQLGVPTANLPPEPLAEELAGLPAGVYFGWARLDADPASPAADGHIHKMVMNIGKRPTFGDQEPATSVEVHVMHNYGADFYGRQMRVVALGYLRPEVKFSGLSELLARIRTDIGIAKTQLDLPQWQEYMQDVFLR